MKKTYHIVFVSGEEVSGTATEIVCRLRDTSKFESELPRHTYRVNFAVRHYRVFREVINPLTDETFVRSLMMTSVVKRLQ
jgi:hypothetical protein